MARRLGIEYPGAMHHVINRVSDIGHYRRDVFETVGAGAAGAFQDALAQACDTFKCNAFRKFTSVPIWHCTF